MSVVENTVVITNKVGLHARPAALFVQEAARFHARIQVKHGEQSVNAKSILSVLKLGASQGTTLVFGPTVRMLPRQFWLWFRWLSASLMRNEVEYD